jgi:hypothetical protein
MAVWSVAVRAQEPNRAYGFVTSVTQGNYDWPFELSGP